MTDFGRTRSERGLLRLGIDGPWSAKDFASVLQSIDLAYRSAGAILGSQIEYPVPRLHSNPTTLVGYLRSEAENRLGLLEVFRLQYSSPGVIETLAAFNPLKLIADFIIRLREGATERQRLWYNWDLERRRIEIQGLGLELNEYYADLVGQQNDAQDIRGLLELMSPEVRDQVGVRLIDSIYKLQRVAYDRRVTAVDLLEIDFDDHNDDLDLNDRQSPESFDGSDA